MERKWKRGMKGKVSYIVVLWEGEDYRGEVEFHTYKEAYKHTQERLRTIGMVEYYLDSKDPDDNYYFQHYFLVAELWRIELKVNKVGAEYYVKERSLYFYWTGRRVTYSSGKKRQLSWERIGKIEEALNNGRDEEAKELLEGRG